jgi:peroxidase
MGTSSRAALVCLVLVVLSVARAQELTTTFYDQSCPSLFSIVKQQIKIAVKNEKRMAASLVRLHFHDCFVGGCDGSILLDDAPGIVTEKNIGGNNNSARGFEVVDTIKSILECACPNTVSCADLLAIAARDSAVEVGLTDSYPVYFGRLDSLESHDTIVNEFLPSPVSNYAELVANFAKQNLNETDLIALSGAHTIGRIRCQLITATTLTDPNINSEYRTQLGKECDPALFDPITTLKNLDLKTPDKFDNNYYKNLRRNEGIIPSDQTLQSTKGPNQDIVKDYAQNKENFFRAYGFSSIKMGDIKPAPGTEGEIRKNCRVVNSAAENLRLPSDHRIAFE